MQSDHRAGVCLALTALASIAGFGCATTHAAGTALDAASHPKIQLIFGDDSGTDTFLCDRDTKQQCQFKPVPADHFQRDGTQYIFVTTGCRAFHQIQIENLDSEPVAYVKCAQPKPQDPQPAPQPQPHD